MSNQHSALPMPERFWDRCHFTPEGCLAWDGATDRNGYGIFRKTVAHRVAYEIVNGPVPDGKELDHLCRNRWCVEPSHLEAVTKRENVRRSQSPGGLNARKTHCPAGHPYSGPNLHIRQNGERRCRICVTARNAARYERLGREP